MLGFAVDIPHVQKKGKNVAIKVVLNMYFYSSQHWGDLSAFVVSLELGFVLVRGHLLLQRTDKQCQLKNNWWDWAKLAADMSFSV